MAKVKLSPAQRLQLKRAVSCIQIRVRPELGGSWVLRDPYGMITPRKETMNSLVQLGMLELIDAERSLYRVSAAGHQWLAANS